MVDGDNNDNEYDSDDDHSMTTTITYDDDDNKNHQRVTLSKSYVCIQLKGFEWQFLAPHMHLTD